MSDYCCYDFEVEKNIGGMVYKNSSWNIKSGEPGYLRRIYYCPMCGEKLQKELKNDKEDDSH